MGSGGGAVVTDEASRGLKVGARVEIVASARIASGFVGMCGEIKQLTKPYWMARVKLDDYENLFTCWVEELRVLPLEALEEMHGERGI